MKKLVIAMSLMMGLFLVGGISALSDTPWEAKFSSNSEGYYGFQGDQFSADRIRVTGSLIQNSEDYKDLRGLVRAVVYDERNRKMIISFRPKQADYRGPSESGTYYIYGEADITYYENRFDRTRLNDVDMQLRFNPNTKEVSFDVIPTTQETLTYVGTTIDKLDFKEAEVKSIERFSVRGNINQESISSFVGHNLWCEDCVVRGSMNTYANLQNGLVGSGSLWIQFENVNKVRDRYSITWDYLEVLEENDEFISLSALGNVRMSRWYNYNTILQVTYYKETNQIEIQDEDFHLIV